ncbi:hypothetical protein [Pseudonocardia humida]|uniref:Dockerin domain-containing protein n=1 Tax=Pseudonocardia humida TaxID=2800819 RepID=A0ABT1A8R0_9PSEU|nr:hypothetical protein [Pseudonocardia humida]MCO1659059.1 hypothetical protein [Pseudonocardia humida]
MGSGTSVLAGSSEASTALVPTGRSTAAQIVRVGDVDRDGQVRPDRAAVGGRTMTSIGVESIWTWSPGRPAGVGVDAVAGRFAVPMAQLRWLRFR